MPATIVEEGRFFQVVGQAQGRVCVWQMSEEASARFDTRDEVIYEDKNEGSPSQVFVLDGELRIGFV